MIFFHHISEPMVRSSEFKVHFCYFFNKMATQSDFYMIVEVFFYILLISYLVVLEVTSRKFNTVGILHNEYKTIKYKLPITRNSNVSKKIFFSCFH